MSALNDDLNKARRALCLAEGQLNYILVRFGDILAEQQKYKNIKDLEAVWLYLIKSYGWTPAYVKSMSYENIKFVLSQEMEGFTVSD